MHVRHEVMASRRAELLGWGAACLALVLLAGHSAAALETRQVPVGTFERVHFSGAATVRLSQGVAPRLAVRGDSRLLDAVRVETRDGALYIDTGDSGGAAHGLVLELEVARLREFVSEGDGRVTGDDLEFDELRLEGNGAGSFDMQRLEARALEVRGRGATRFHLSGQVGSQVVDLSGAGAYRATELISDNITLHVAGASDVRLWAEEHLDVEVSGSARIRYAGSPRVEQRISGFASVLRIPQIAI